MIFLVNKPSPDPIIQHLKGIATEIVSNGSSKLNFVSLLRTTLTNHPSTSSFLKTHLTTTLDTPSKAISKSTNAKHNLLLFVFFAKYLFCTCLEINMAFVVTHRSIKSNCISPMSPCCVTTSQ